MVLRIVTLLSLLALVLVSCEEPNPATDNPNYKDREGKLIYNENCLQCHGKDGEMGGSGAKDLSISKLKSKGIADIVKNGKNGMPRLGDKIYTEGEMSNVVKYVKALRK